jgi:hypothetical protein
MAVLAAYAVFHMVALFHVGAWCYAWAAICGVLVRLGFSWVWGPSANEVAALEQVLVPPQQEAAGREAETGPLSCWQLWSCMLQGCSLLLRCAGWVLCGVCFCVAVALGLLVGSQVYVHQQARASQLVWLAVLLHTWTLACWVCALLSASRMMPCKL